MKKLVQLIIFLILLILITIFYSEYFLVVKKKDEVEELTSSQQEEMPLRNNIIKNLNYEISINKNNMYKINSEKSEITYVKGIEVVLMKNVKAILTNEEKNSIFIVSDNAIYNNDNYNTNFENNVQIEYLDYLITSEKMVLDFGESSILIINKVKFEGPKGTLEADNVKINLITKKIEIFMNKNNKNVLIKSTK